MTFPWLSQDEIDDLCEPLVQHAAQIRWLRGIGLTVKTKRNGAPLVMRAHCEQILNDANNDTRSRSTGSCEPNRLGLIAHIRKAA